ncbi:unnamed protein product [Clonostachys rhizophaga]|uniref:Uncharacterized protein n=1 Tax=Clonostachys rhizophaga TaxID=160324 RepID=A0A9N9VE14_9HYPO|nr:unnamed protein product [Clonostachys rhizophaga]
MVAIEQIRNELAQASRSGRQLVAVFETPDGLDRKMALDFYSRLRFTENLLPLLRYASSLSSSQSTRQVSPAGGRVISVLGGGKETSIDESDLSLKLNYTLKASTDHAVTMTTNSFQRLAAAPENANVAFFHTSPGMVKTNGDRELNFVIRLLESTVSYVFRPWITSTEETGKRHLWAAVSDAFRGGQVYLLNQRSERVDNSKVLNRIHEEGLSDRVWEHTREVFNTIPTGDNHNA